MLNYEIDPTILAADVPPGTELDFYNGTTFVSMVGFMFLGTKVLGLSIPFHRNFEEINLRFYVRREGADGIRRGVSFIKEIVPRRAIAAIARIRYNEKYVGLPMRHRIDITAAGSPTEVEYSWRFLGRWNRLGLTVTGDAQKMASGSLDEFIAEHYWGYTSQRDGGCMEYRVEHPQWRIWNVDRAWLDCDVAGFYGERFEAVLSAKPVSAFLAEGSGVAVYKGARL